MLDRPTLKPRRAAPAPAHLRRRLEAAAERIIAALDALDASEEDLEDGHDAEAFADDEEPSLGSTNHPNQEKAWRADGEPDLEFEGDTVADCDLEDGDDREDDPAESGIGDEDGYREQLTGEPSLGATSDIDQAVAWGPDRLSGVFDGEASGTEDDLQVYQSGDTSEADRQAANAAASKAREMAFRKRARDRGSYVHGLPFLGTVR